MTIFVRVECKNERKFIEIEDIDSLTVQNFPALVVNKFQIQNAKGKNVYIHDQYDTRIYETKELKFLLQTQLNTLILKVKFQQLAGRRSINHTFTSKEIEEYLKKRKAEEILKNFKQNTNISVKNRRILFNLIVDLLVEKSGSLYPNIVAKTSIAKATVTLFPIFKDEDSNDEIGLLYNQTKDCGFFISILKGRRKAAKNAAKRQNETQQFGEENVLEQAETDIQCNDEEQAKRDVTFLRTTVYDESMEQTFAKKLKATIVYREKLCKDLNVNVVERFPYFFINTDLILLDFDVRYNIPRNIFLQKWSQVKGNIKSVHSSKAYKKDGIPAQLGEEIEQMLLLLQMLPDVPKGKKSTKKRLTFAQSVEKLIIFSPPNVSICNLVDHQNKQPYIILKGESPTNPLAYYIMIDNEAICVKNVSTFAEVFDVFFKVHYIFNLQFHECLQTLMDFVGHFFYGLPSSFKPTTVMKAIHNGIKTCQQQ